MYQLRIHCKEAAAEAIAEQLELGPVLALSFLDEADEPILEPALGTTPLWPNLIIEALYEKEAEAISAWERVQTDFALKRAEIELVPEQDWERVCLDNFKPLAFGQRLWICPSWISPPDPNAVNIILDPGLAFGTGTHQTTALCLEWLERQQLAGTKLIDYGCGSGILAIAGLKLGAEKAYAIDIDPQALQATAANAAVNQIPDTKLLLGSAEILEEPVDLLIANILFGPLLSLKLSFLELLKPEGRLLVSGLLKTQAESLIRDYQSHFDCQEQAEKEDWSALLFTRKI